MADLSTTCSGINFSGCVYNAAGPNDTTLEELEAIAGSGAAAVVTKTTTMQPRTGNPEPRYFEMELGSLNSMGLPNPGIAKMKQNVVELKKTTKKPVIASFQGFNADECEVLAREYGQVADMLELNLSCPNIIGKPQVAYDCAASEKYILAAQKGNEKKLPLTIKLSPYIDAAHQNDIYEVIKRTGIRMVTSVNSPGNALWINERNEIAIKPKFGGLGGAFIKPIALGNVRRFYELSKGSLHITGVGGVTNGRDALDLILAGASHVGIGTQFAMDGPVVFARVHSELSSLLDEFGFSSVRDAVGKAKEL